jgi:hypothetical protein
MPDPTNPWSMCCLHEFGCTNDQPPPLTHLMAANEPPSEDEAPKVRDIIGAVQPHVLELDTSIVALSESALAELRQTRKEANRHMPCCRSTLCCSPSSLGCTWGNPPNYLTMPAGHTMDSKLVGLEPPLGPCPGFARLEESLSSRQATIDSSAPLPAVPPFQRMQAYNKNHPPPLRVILGRLR